MQHMQPALGQLSELQAKHMSARWRGKSNPAAAYLLTITDLFSQMLPNKSTTTEHHWMLKLKAPCVYEGFFHHHDCDVDCNLEDNIANHPVTSFKMRVHKVFNRGPQGTSFRSTSNSLSYVVESHSEFAPQQTT